jgi:hypothetical protein
MRTAFYLLLLANLGFFAWSYYDSGLPASEMQLIEQQLNPQAIRLLTAEQRASLAAERPKVPAVKACMELGPFNTGDVPNVEQALGPLALGPKLSQRRADELASHWVFIPPLASRQAANQKTAELRKLGVEEFFVVQEDPKFRFAISLGIFKTEEAAKAQLEQLRAKGVRSAQVGARETSVQKNYFLVRDVAEALAAKLDELRQGFPGSELKECQSEEKRP